MTVLTAHIPVQERRAQGTLAIERTPVDSHTGWVVASDRPDPVDLLQEQDATREPDLVPVRHGRMMFSPFTFYRGAAKIMAADLKDTPTSGLTVQLCGDAHLSNFGLFASPERHLVFDLNDFDETLPGPFEYDVKRMAASFTVAARNNGFSKSDALAVTLASVAAYREAMAEFSQMRTLDVYYAHLSEDEIKQSLQSAVTKAGGSRKDAKSKKASKEAKKVAQTALKNAEKAHTRDSLQALSKLVETVDGRYRIRSQPPLIIPLRELSESYGTAPEDVDDAIRKQFHAYRKTLQDDRRALLERFEIIDVARKVVGVGSVGTRAFIALLLGRDEQDPLFLQVKEAQASVFEGILPKSKYRQHGERVVQGQRRMQATSDIFLGWTRGVDASRHFYWRQLRDMKGSALVDAMQPFAMTFYARTCGWTLARAHARSGDPVAISSYLGTSDAFDVSLADFARRYADRNEQDFGRFIEAVRSGRITAIEGV